MPEWERTVVDEVATRLAEDPYWGEKLAPWREGKAVPFAWHLAVFVEPFLTYVLEGTKKVESRFSVNDAAPYRKVEKGDVILIKSSGGPIVGIAEAAEATSYQIDSAGLDLIRAKFGQALCIEGEEFLDGKTGCLLRYIGTAFASQQHSAYRLRQTRQARLGNLAVRTGAAVPINPGHSMALLE